MRFPHAWAALVLTVSPAAPTVPCDAAPGTTVTEVAARGGNGKPVRLSLGAGAAPDYQLSGTRVVVGAAGLSPGRCGATGVVRVVGVQ